MTIDVVFNVLFLIIFIPLVTLWGIAMIIATGYSLYLMGFILYDVTFDPHGVWKHER